MTLPDDRKSAVPPAETARLLDPPKFSLRAMLLAMAAICGSFALAKVVGPLGMGAALIGSGVILAHVVGNALGTRLRDGDGGRTSSGDDYAERAVITEREVPRGGAQDHHFAPTTRLSRRVPLGRIQLFITVLGGLLGAGGGIWALDWLYPDSVTLSALFFGGVATGALAAFWSFWTFSLTQVFLGAWWEAHRHGHPRR